MARGRTVSHIVRKIVEGAGGPEPDELIVEEPLEIRLDGHRVSTTMRTPGHDEELAVGFCFGDGLLAGAPVTAVRSEASGQALGGGSNVVTVETGGVAPAPTARLTTTTSSCGWCGTDEIDAVIERLPPLGATAAFDPALLARVPDLVAPYQELFDETGGVHAAAAFTPDGQVVLVREDIGRHNAVDKVVGRLLLDGRLPASDLALFVSGRTSFEIVQKAWAAGIGTVVSVSAASSLAVAAATRANLALAGFARAGRANLYVERTG
jgi:FdhD protein